MSHPVSIEVGGRTVTVTYAVRGGMITVSTLNGEKTAQIGNMDAQVLARMLLRELANEGSA